MSTGTALSGERLLKDLGDVFLNFPDHRKSPKVTIPFKDFLMSGLALFSMKFSSLLKLDGERKKDFGFSQVASIFRISKVPSDTQMRAVLDELPSHHFRPAFTHLFEKAQRNHALKDFLLWNKTYLVSVDGSGYFYSDSIHCDQCQEKLIKETGKKSYYHQMLVGAVVHTSKTKVIPFCPEPIMRQDGAGKNDCERAAMKRFIENFRKEHPKLPVTILTDALHSTTPLLKLLKEKNMSFILSAKPGSHTKLFERMDEFNELGRMRSFSLEEEIGIKIKKKKIKEYRYWNGVSLNQADGALPVNFLDFTETTQWVNQKGKLKTKVVRFSWVTDIALYDSSCLEVETAGRARWQIENAAFNTLKNHGYEFEHNFGHGYKNLTTNFAHLMMLAFTIDQLQEMGSKAFQNLRNQSKRKSDTWEKLRAVFLIWPKEILGFEQLLEICENPRKYWGVGELNSS